MKFDDAVNFLSLVPYTSPSKGKFFYDFVLKNKPKKCLELGFAHGTATNYIAAALDELNENGHIDAVDLVNSKNTKPSIEELLKKTGLKKNVSIFREQKSYNWFLHKQIIKNSDNKYNCNPEYDFIFIDGPKDWTIDGFAFFLSDKLLKKNGYIIFDDYLWNDYKKINQNIPDYDPLNFSSDQISMPNIKQVFHLLVMQNPNYCNFEIIDDILAIAQKKNDNSRFLKFNSKASFKYKFIHTIKKLVGRNY